MHEKQWPACSASGLLPLRKERYYCKKVKKQRIIKARKEGADPMQQEENYLAQTISQADVDARYDEGVRRLLANKSILALS